MRQITIKWFVCAVFLGVLIIACAGTKLTHTQVDESRQGKPVSNILVIGVTYKEKEMVRQSFEDRFVSQLRAAGVEAISSGDAISIPADLMLEKDEILSTPVPVALEVTGAIMATMVGLMPVPQAIPVGIPFTAWQRIFTMLKRKNSFGPGNQKH
jgi:hypothetical protein